MTITCPDGHRMSRAQRRMMIRVLDKPGYIPSRSSTKRTARILLKHGALHGSVKQGLTADRRYLLANGHLFQQGGRR